MPSRKPFRVIVRVRRLAFAHRCIYRPMRMAPGFHCFSRFQTNFRLTNFNLYVRAYIF